MLTKDKTGIMSLEKLIAGEFKGAKERNFLLNNVFKARGFIEFFKTYNWTEEDRTKGIKALYDSYDCDSMITLLQEMPHIFTNDERKEIIKRIGTQSSYCFKALDIGLTISEGEREILIKGICKYESPFGNFFTSNNYIQRDREIAFQIIIENAKNVVYSEMTVSYIQTLKPQNEERQMMVEAACSMPNSSKLFLETCGYTSIERELAFKGAIRTHNGADKMLTEYKGQITDRERRNIYQKHKTSFLRNRSFDWFYETFKDLLTSKDAEFLIKYILNRPDKIKFSTIKALYELNKNNNLGLDQQLRDRFDGYALGEILTSDNMKLATK